MATATLSPCPFSTARFAWARRRSSRPTNSVSGRINGFEPELETYTDEELREAADALRERAQAGETLDDLLFECFALVREAGKRSMGMRHFDVQLIGGMVLHDGAIAEMKTGEGKTLTAHAAGGAQLARRPRRARRDGQRLPGAARRDVDEADLRHARRHGRGAAEHAALRGEARRVRRRRHVRHQLRVRLRLPARQHGDVARGEGPARRSREARGGQVALPHVRDRRRGRQHPDRRGANAADHLRRARAGGRLLRASSRGWRRRCSPARRPKAWTRG